MYSTALVLNAMKAMKAMYSPELHLLSFGAHDVQPLFVVMCFGSRRFVHATPQETLAKSLLRECAAASVSCDWAWAALSRVEILDGKISEAASHLQQVYSIWFCLIAR